MRVLVIVICVMLLSCGDDDVGCRPGDDICVDDGIEFIWEEKDAQR